jgi:DNA-binding NtrC family response regulator
MNGSIRVETSLGHGSTFFVTLPGAVLPSEGESRLPPPLPPTAVSADKPSLLVIDDEVTMCSVLRLLLDDFYEVTTLSSPRAALQSLLAGQSYDAVLCDVMMPDMTGMDLYEELARQRPDLTSRFIFMTGGTFTARARAFLEALDTAPLSKPFRLDQVRAAVEARLRAARAAQQKGQSN